MLPQEFTLTTLPPPIDGIISFSTIKYSSDCDTPAESTWTEPVTMSGYENQSKSPPHQMYENIVHLIVILD